MTPNGGGDGLDRPNPARIYDYALGGHANFAADRAAFDALSAVYPDSALAARANRAFLRRAVTFLAQQGIDQFLDVGSGLPTVGNVHEVAQAINPAARIAYVDNDPVAVRYSRQILEENGIPSTNAIEADMRDPAAILAHPRTRGLLDLGRPVALLLLAALPFIPDDSEARRVVQELTADLPAGSYLVISHATYHGASVEALERFARVYEARTSSVAFRSPIMVEDYFAGFMLVPPGLVFVPEWRPNDPRDPLSDEPERAAIMGGVGRKM